MRLFLNRLHVLFKRVLKNPIMYFMTAVLLVLSVLSVVMPEEKSSSYIPVAILNKDESDESSDVVKDLTDNPSVFRFYEVESNDELYEAITSGEAQIGFILPGEIIEEAVSVNETPEVEVIVTSSSTLVSLAEEEVFNSLFRHIAYTITEDIIAGSLSVTGEEDLSRIKEIYDFYISGFGIYHLTSLDGTTYGNLTESSKIEIPVYKFAGLFIFVAAILGILASMRDADNGIYLRMNRMEKIVTGFSMIMVYELPMTLISVLMFVLFGISFDAVHVIIYSLAVPALSLIVIAVLNILPIRTGRARILSAVLPTYLLLTVIFSEIFFKISYIAPALRFMGLLFPPFYF